MSGHIVEKDALIEKASRVLLDTADMHDLGWNNLRTTASALLPLFADLWDQGYRTCESDFGESGDDGDVVTPNPYVSPPGDRSES